MNITEATPTAALTISGVSLTVAQPFAEGHVLTAGEAAVLNQTYAENIRNNMATKVTAALTAALGPDETLTAENRAAAIEACDISAIQTMVDEYQSTYEFGVRRSGSGGPRISDPIEVEALGIARQKVRDAIKAKGHKLSDVGTDKINQLAKQVLDNYPQIREQARQIVEARKSVALDNLDL